MKTTNSMPDRITHNIVSEYPLTVAQWELAEDVDGLEVE